MTINWPDYIDAIPDFPEKGILFRDISPLLTQKFPEAIDAMLDLWSPEEMQGIDAIAGIDARGFIFAAGMAARANKQMVMIRKGGKLPPPHMSEDYTLEYGQASIEMKSGNGRILLFDDVIATAGTLEAAANLCSRAGYEIAGLGALINLSFLNDFIWRDIRPKTLITYES